MRWRWSANRGSARPRCSGTRAAARRRWCCARPAPRPRRDLPFAALLSLLRPVLHLLDRLPPVQARALEGALALGPPALADRLVVHAAALGLLSAAAEDGPCWRSSTTRTGSTTRPRTRCCSPPAGSRASGRAAAGAAAGRGPPARPRGRRAAARRRPRARRGRGAAARGAARRSSSGCTPPRPGNPLALLEAPAHLPGEQLAGRDPLGDPLPVGPGVQAGFRRRLERLPPRTRIAPLLVAAGGAEPLATIAAAGAELGVSLADLDPPRPTTWSSWPPTRSASATRSCAPPPTGRPRAASAAPSTARSPPTPPARAAPATCGPPRRASTRWPPPRWRRPPSEARGRTGFARRRAGDGARGAADRARRRARRAAVRGRPGPPDRRRRARAVELAREACTRGRRPAAAPRSTGLLGSIEMLAGSLDERHRHAARRRRADRRGRPGARAPGCSRPRPMTCYMAGRSRARYAAERARVRTRRRAGGRTERDRRACCSASAADLRPRHRRRRARAARPLAGALDERILVPGAPHLIGTMPFRTWLEHYDEAEAFAAQVDAAGRRQPARSARCRCCARGSSRSTSAAATGPSARARASEALRLGEETGQLAPARAAVAMLARLDAAMGLEDECRASVREARSASRSRPGWVSMNVYRRGGARPARARPRPAERAAEHLDAGRASVRRLRPARPERRPVSPRPHRGPRPRRHPERARAALRSSRRWPCGRSVVAAGLRRALSRDAGGRLRTLVRAGLRGARAGAVAVRVGRTELVSWRAPAAGPPGREARERLRSALERFEALGAAPWAARARAELRAAAAPSARARASTREFTPQELEVALAVARGATNREVAAALT